MKKKLLLSFAIACVTARFCAAQSAVTEVDWNNGNTTLLLDQNGVALSQGVATTNTDGTLVQLGYFSLGTTASNFAGTWIPITGFGAAGHTSIGDSFDLTGSGNGRLAFATIFRDTTNVVQVFDPLNGDPGAYLSQSSVTITTTTPPNGQVLAIRFFNTTTGTTGAYNTVSSDNWIWVSPSDNGSNVLVNLTTAAAAGTLQWESFDVYGISHATGDFRTVILIPEPSTYALIGLGALGLIIGYRRRSKTVA